MNKLSKVAIVFTLLVATTFSVSAKSAPGLASTFYRGVTTIATSSSTELVTTTEVLESYSETRAIGGNNNILQDRLVSTVVVTVTEVTTTTFEQHRGVAHSNGVYLGSFTETSSRVISQETISTVGEWGPAYNLPSEIL